MLLVAILVVAIFSLIVFVHELGHFVAARRNGIEVEEFGFGFPPRLWGRQIGKTVYSINLLPLGGFVRLKGEDSAQTSAGSFSAASLKAKAKVLLAGVGMNLLLAYAILLVLCFSGLPPLMSGQFNIGQPTYAQPKQLMIVEVAPDSPAAKAGLRRGDIVLTAAGQALIQETDLTDFTKSHAGQRVDFGIKRGDQLIRQQIQLNASGPGYLGVAPFQTYKLRYGWQAPLVAAGLTAQLAWATLAAFGGLIVGLVAHAKVSDNVAGPVGIVSILASLVQLGVAYIAIFIVSISTSLAVINALPLPALDGGRLFIIVLQHLTGKKLSAEREGWIHKAGFFLLIGLVIVITYFDIRKVFGR